MYNSMTYSDININDNIDRYLETIPREIYPTNVNDEIYLLSFAKKNEAHPFGSYIYRLQKYPGDIDLIENYTNCCSEEDAIRKFIESLKRMIRKINKLRNHYFSEFKAGVDERYDLNKIGTMKSGMYFMDPQLPIFVKKLYRRKLIDNEEYEILKKMIGIVEKMHIGTPQQYRILNREDTIKVQNAYDIIHKIMRDHYILRWDSKEILKGSKIVKGKTIFLKDALKKHMPIKIDLIVLLNGRYVEITNFILLGYRNGKDNKIYPINLNPEFVNIAGIDLPIEIEKLYYSNLYYSPFKMLKRMFAWARYGFLYDKRSDNARNYKSILEKMIPFVSSNASFLYQLKSEIDTIIRILNIRKSIPNMTINKQLESIAIRIARIIQISKEDSVRINDLIWKAIKEKKKDQKIKYLDMLQDEYIIPIINWHVVTFMNKSGLNPPPDFTLPRPGIVTTENIQVEYPKYLHNIIRTPSDSPNPFNMDEIPEYEIVNDYDIVFDEFPDKEPFDYPLHNRLKTDVPDEKELDPLETELQEDNLDDYEIDFTDEKEITGNGVNEAQRELEIEHKMNNIWKKIIN